MSDIELRMWAVEQATQVCVGDPFEVINKAHEILAFVLTSPAADQSLDATPA